MKTIDFILSYIRENSTEEEKQQILDSIQVYKAPPLDVDAILNNLIKTTRDKWFNGQGRLQIVKYVKEVTCWGLKDSKDWCDQMVFTMNRPEHIENNNSLNF